MSKPLQDVRHEEAAQLLAEGRYSTTEIARRMGVTRATLYEWRRKKLFGARVESIQRDLCNLAMKRGIARKEYRLDLLADKQSDLLKIIEERAADMADIPGGSTGLLVRKAIASAGQLLGYEYAVDTGLLAEIRRMNEMVAKELGQVVEKHEHQMRSLKDMSDAELATLAASLDDAGEGENGDPEGDRETEEA